MKGCQLSDGGAVSMRHAAYSPGVETLGRELEGRTDQLGADLVDEATIGAAFSGHDPLYQRSVYTSRGQTFIGLAAALMHKLAVADDPEFGERLRALIPLAGYKNPRRFAIDGMGWPESAGPQRLNNHLHGRIPDVETLVQMAGALKVSVSDLVGLHNSSSAADEGMKGILRQLLELEGIPPAKADTIASTSVAARRLLEAFPEEEPLPIRAKFAARAAWLQQPTTEQDT